MYKLFVQNKTVEQQIELLRSLEKKGVTDVELASFIKQIQQRMSASLSIPGAIDVCGTGGSGLPRFNTSTVVAFILAALGVTVVKHGNRAASGRCGSFDLLEALGIGIDLSPAALMYAAQKEHLAFAFARQFHPEMKSFVEARKAIGHPTFFNLMGPLLNPANVERQVIGTTFRDKMELIARTAQRLGKKHVYVVCGEDGLDEVTLTGKTEVVEMKGESIRRFVILPQDFGLKPCSFEAMAGGDVKRNAAIALRILKGTCRTRHLDLVLINAALALKLAGVANTLREGYKKAHQAIASGKAYQTFQRYRELSRTPSILLEIAENKRHEVAERKKKVSLATLKKSIRPSDRNFHTALSSHKLSMIAEIKRASPSAGRIARDVFDPLRMAQIYEHAGAAAISVLTDKKYFNGNLGDLKKVCKITTTVPILLKDFVIDEYQIYEARRFGANAVLLIAALLDEETLSHFLNILKKMRMRALVEVHDREELEKVLRTSAEIIGINNRNLHTFEIDMKTTERLCAGIPREKIVVSESGFFKRNDVSAVPARTNAILVGSALMQSPAPGAKIKELLGQPLLKICGIRSVAEAMECERLGVDFLGLNFVPTSRRCISIQLGKAIRRAIKHVPLVGIFQNQPIVTVNRIAKSCGLDFIQLSGDESIEYVQKCTKPVIKGVSIKNKNDLKKIDAVASHATYLLVDSPSPGQGKTIDTRLIKKISSSFLIAGGITPDNVRSFLKFDPLGIDVASGVETHGRIDLKKVKTLISNLELL